MILEISSAQKEALLDVNSKTIQLTPFGLKEDNPLKTNCQNQLRFTFERNSNEDLNISKLSF